jgi:hypothetical protein
VAGADFTFYGFQPRTGGFHGTFTTPQKPDPRLETGLMVRIAHREGRILRIEVAGRAPGRNPNW